MGAQASISIMLSPVDKPTCLVGFRTSGNDSIVHVVSQVWIHESDYLQANFYLVSKQTNKLNRTKLIKNHLKLLFLALDGSKPINTTTTTTTTMEGSSHQFWLIFPGGTKVF